MKIIYSTLLLTLLLIINELLAQEQLPIGTHPTALEFSYCPSRNYSLVWRNWNLVEPARIVQTIGTDVNDINLLYAS